ncbi:MAG: penicillin-binding transpeptidase domain-containing protein [Thermodesulfobacteriota bacterium]
MLDHTGNESVSIAAPDVDRLERQNVAALLDGGKLHNLTRKDFQATMGVGDYHVYTSLDPNLQTQLIDALDKKYAQTISIVAIEPDTGRLLAMVSHDRTGKKSEPCLRADWPAASVFKIVTAAAALEAGELECQSRLPFNGGKYTLYRSQLQNQRNKYTNYISFEDAFAKSINPVFGKIGKDRLGKSVLEKYARAFGFNRPIAFDLPVGKSVLTISDKPYNWAEIACGFNKTTLISPLHGAMMAAAVVNGGTLMAPTIVEAIGMDGKTVFRRQSEQISQAVSQATAKGLQEIMHATVTEGTARKTFRNIANDPVLSRLTIGGKTGSINNNPEHIKYDWFVGFAKDSITSKKLAVAVLVAHKKYIGTRAAKYFRTTISEFFETRIETARTS